MASEWAKKTAQNVVRPLKDRIYREMSAENYDNTWDRVAEALDAAHAKGLEEAAKVAEALGKRYDEACKRAGTISVMSCGCFNVAVAVRALLEKEPTS